MSDASATDQTVSTPEVGPMSGLGDLAATTSAAYDAALKVIESVEPRGGQATPPAQGAQRAARAQACA